jgi:phosphotransferase system enzyme I (PtsP)
MFNVLRSVIERCDAAGVALSLCGEMAGQPLEAMALVGLGLRRLSVSPPCVGPIKMMIRSVTLSSLSDFVARLCRCEQRSVREDLLSFARDHGIVVG